MKVIYCFTLCQAEATGPNLSSEAHSDAIAQMKGECSSLRQVRRSAAIKPHHPGARRAPLQKHPNF
jgi:hypothetical protein